MKNNRFVHKYRQRVVIKRRVPSSIVKAPVSAVAPYEAENLKNEHNEEIRKAKQFYNSYTEKFSTRWKEAAVGLLICFWTVTSAFTVQKIDPMMIYGMAALALSFTFDGGQYFLGSHKWLSYMRKNEPLKGKPEFKMIDPNNDFQTQELMFYLKGIAALAAFIFFVHGAIVTIHVNHKTLAAKSSEPEKQDKTINPSESKPNTH